jgi:hypothetical protein
MPHEIKILPDLTTRPERPHFKPKDDLKVRWSADDFDDWRVVFGPESPVKPKVAWPGGEHPPQDGGGPSDTLTLEVRRPEDYRHVKYVVVTSNKDGLSHTDPELIVDE